MTSLDVEFRDEFRGRKVVITGATGFIGRNLCRALSGLGAEVVGLCRSAQTLGGTERVTSLAVDLRRSDETREALACIRPDLIFHLAGHVTGRPDPFLVLPTFEANAVGTVNLLLAARQGGCGRFILVGSLEAAGGGASCGLGSPYAVSKAVAELYGQMFHRLFELPVVCLRPSVTYGPWQRPTKLVPYTILTLLRGETPALTSGQRICDVIYVEDVVRGLLRAALASDGVLGACLDLGTGKGISIRELVETVAKLLGATSAPRFGARLDRPHEHTVLADVERTHALLGWSPQWQLEEGLRETVAWYQQHVDTGGFA